MRAPDPLLNRETLERLERLALRWQQSFQGLLGGHNVSRFAGVGHEFLDHRPFHQGDDLRSVNWRAYLRLERLFLKMFRTEPRTPVRILIDTSESMVCGASESAPGEAKFHYACRLAAALTYVGLVRLETIVLHPFAGALDESFRAQGGRHRYARAAQFLGDLETGGRSDFHTAVRQFCSGVTLPGLAIVLSDFLDESDCADALQQLADQRHELHLVHLAGPDDRMPPFDGELELMDAESGEVRRVQMDRASALEYAEAYDEYCRGIEYAALKNEGRYLHLTTDVPLEEALYGAVMATGAVALH